MCFPTRLYWGEWREEKCDELFYATVIVYCARNAVIRVLEIKSDFLFSFLSPHIHT